jgi:hypothetical protein
MAASEASPSLEAAVLWSYRLLLGREPESVEALRLHAHTNRSIDEVRRAFMQSDEFARRTTEAGLRWIPKCSVSVREQCESPESFGFGD